MKKTSITCWAAFFCLVLGMAAAEGASAFQPMAIFGKSLELAANGVNSISAFCLDAAKEAPGLGTPYGYVLKSSGDPVVRFGDGSSEPLAQALAEGKISVNGNGGYQNLQFKNNTSQKAQLDFHGPTVFGSGQDDEVGPEAWDTAKQLLESSDDAIHSALQGEIWNPSSLTETMSQMRDAGLDVRKVQHALAVPESGQIDRSTLEALVNRQKLVELGYANHQITPQFDGEFSGSLKKFQQNRGLPLTGKLDEATVDEIEDTSFLVHHRISEVGFGDLKDFQAYHNLEPTGRLDDPSKAKLFEDRRLLKAVQEVQARVAEGSVFHAAGGDVVRFCYKGEEGFPIYTRISRNGSDELWITDEEGDLERSPVSDAIKKLEADAQNLVAEFSGENVNFAYVGSKTADNAYDIRLGDHVLKSAATEFDAFMRGDGGLASLDGLLKNGSETTPTKLVVYRDARARLPAGEAYNDPAHVTVDPVNFAKALKNKYRDRLQVYLDDEPETAIRNLDNATEVRSGNDIAVYLDKENFAVKDYDVVDHIKANLESAHIKIVPNAEPTDEANLIVITGHKDQRLRDYLEHLNANDVFRGKTVVLASCYSSGDASFNSRLIQEGGSRGALFFTEEINPQAVEDVLVALTEIVSDPNMASVSFESLFNRAVSRAQQSAPAKRIPDIEKLRNNLMQISQSGRLFFDESL